MAGGRIRGTSSHWLHCEFLNDDNLVKQHILKVKKIVEVFNETKMFHCQ